MELISPAPRLLYSGTFSLVSSPGHWGPRTKPGLQSLGQDRPGLLLAMGRRSLTLWGPRVVLDLGGQHRGQRGPQTGRGVGQDVTTRGIPGERARGRPRHVTQVLGPALRARPSARPLDAKPPQDRAARNPGQPVSAAARPPFLRAGPSAPPRSWVLGQHRPLLWAGPSGARVAWGEGDLVFVLE